MKIGPTALIFVLVLTLCLINREASVGQDVNLADAAQTYRLRDSAHSVQSSPNFDNLIRIIRPIAVISELPDGRTQLRTGTGFIIGTRYVTVHHNLTSNDSSRSSNNPAYLDGFPITPSYFDARHDLAIFDIPEELCVRYCNDYLLHRLPTLEPGQKVSWLIQSDGEVAPREGRILNYAYLGDIPPAHELNEFDNCEANLIVEVDTPFLPGSSGGPVLDSTTGQIIGIIQGSLEGDGSHRGFFKPVNCIARLIRIAFN
jgi:hypothetical protein